MAAEEDSSRFAREEEEDDDVDIGLMNSLFRIHLGGGMPRKYKRTDAEIVSSYATIKKEDREKLRHSEFSKLQLAAEEGEKTLFTLVEPLPVEGVLSTGQIKKLSETQALLKTSQRSMHTFDMIDVFNIPKVMKYDADEDVWFPVGTTSINLYENPKGVSLSTVKQSCKFMAEYGQDYLIQNLTWSGKRLLNSCDIQLRGKIMEEVSGCDITAQAGPVYLKILIDLTLSASDQSLRGLVKQFQTLSPASFRGENVLEYVSHARGAYVMLKQHNALPFDTLLIVVNALKKASTEQFTTLIQTAYNNHVLGHGPHGMPLTVDKLFDLAQQEYNSLATSGEWNRGNEGQDHDAAFYNGGRGRGGRGRGGGRGGRGGHVDNGGRGVHDDSVVAGRGRGGGRTTGGRGGFGRDRRPPAPGEPRERDGNGRPEKWCGSCGYWTWGADYAHTSDVCPYRQQHAANVSATDASQLSANAPSANAPVSGQQNAQVAPVPDTNNGRGDANTNTGQRVNFAGVPALHFA
jgi:hypothetical protein